MNRTWVTGKQKNALRAKLRKGLKDGTLQARRTYYDYYDSCHAPTETPEAEFMDARELLRPEHLKVGGPSLAVLDDGSIELHTSYSTYQVRFK